jgi:hypothetical protein
VFVLLIEKEAEMFDPFQAHFAGKYQAGADFNLLDEEQYAQRYGRVVSLPPFGRKFTLRLGKLFIRIGEKLTGECSVVELSRENT